MTAAGTSAPQSTMIRGTTTLRTIARGTNALTTAGEPPGLTRDAGLPTGSHTKVDPDLEPGRTKGDHTASTVPTDPLSPGSTGLFLRGMLTTEPSDTRWSPMTQTSAIRSVF